jgi:glycosyltransferase involved in cell wall biosynthesis
MYKDKKVIVVMPAYSGKETRQTYDEVMQQDYVDLVIVVDDGSNDETVAIAKTLPNGKVYIHPNNRGYGANQKHATALL